MSAHHPPERLRSSGISMPNARHLLRNAGPLARLVHAIAARRKRERERRELDRMSPRELHDIGLTRGDIDRVFDPANACEFARRGKCVPMSRDR